MSNTPEYNHRYWLDHREAILARRRYRYQTDPEYRHQVALYTRTYQDAHKDQYRAYMRKYYRKNRVLNAFWRINSRDYQNISYRDELAIKEKNLSCPSFFSPLPKPPRN